MPIHINFGELVSCLLHITSFKTILIVHIDIYNCISCNRVNDYRNKLVKQIGLRIKSSHKTAKPSVEGFTCMSTVILEVRICFEKAHLV